LKKRIMILFVAMLLAIPSLSYARGSSGGHSFSSHSSFSSHTSSFSHSSFSSHSTASSSRPRVNLSKSTTTTAHSTGYRSPSYRASSVRRSTVAYHAGSTYTSHSTRVYVNHHYVSVNHYYHAGYSPSGWFGYYHGFTHAMILSSLWHPWGGTYYVGHHYVEYGQSPLAWTAWGVGSLLVVGTIIALVVIL
jgi:hypothetical protein